MELGCTREEARDFYAKMILIRRFEEAAAEAYVRGRIGGFLHLAIGQEATNVGEVAGVRPNDAIFTSYRDHGQALARGLDPMACMAELFGRATGVARGRGGSMHLFDAKKDFYGGYGIVGAHLCLAAGFAWAMQYAKQDRIALCIFGEGATNIGMFHEAVNLAAVWKLPCVFVCENNRYGMGTEIGKASALVHVHEKSAGYGIPGDLVCGTDPVEVRDAVRAAAGRAREGGGPTLIEVQTYRFVGHSMGDAQKYRTKDEVEREKAADPIPAFRRKIEAARALAAEVLDEIEAEGARIAKEAVAFAESSPEPTAEALEEEMYAAPARRQ